MRSVTDDRGRIVQLGAAPRRVVSLVPSDTFNVAALGAAGQLVGCTDYCELPEDVVARLARVGGTKNPRIDAVCALEPDLVIANQEENSKADLEALAQRGIRVFVAFPKRVAEGLAHLARLARILGVDDTPEVIALIARGYGALGAAEARAAASAPISTFCPIWMDPLMTIHGDTFMSDALRLAGARNVFADRERRYPLAADLGLAAARSGASVAGRDTRYPRVTLEEVVRRAPELVLLPDEPHPFTDSDAEVFRALDVPAARADNVRKVGGKDLCWYGARSIDGIERVRALVDAARERASLAR